MTSKINTKLKTGQISRRSLFTRSSRLALDDVASAREYIKDYWPKLITKNTSDHESLIGLPKPYIVPAREPGVEFDFDEMYYWDSYFIIQGLLTDSNKDLVEGMLENLEYMLDRFGLIPNASRTYFMGRSQPPLLTSIIFDLYDTFEFDKKWLKKHIEFAQREYHAVWLGKKSPHWRSVYEGLSRYYDINMINDLVEAESGWDMTPRFNRRALDYLPVDLNALLYKYEMDFARAEQIFGEDKNSLMWRSRAVKRTEAMNKLMWDKGRGMYFDYNFVKQRRGNVASLATYFPLWSGQASEEQARDLVKKLKRFMNRGGLTTTDALPLGSYVPGAMPMQWAYPNGWAPLHFIVVKGLERYGYNVEAREIAIKWLKTCNNWFVIHGNFLEKYNVVSPSKPPIRGLYPSQVGFGWTNAIFERFCEDYL